MSFASQVPEELSLFNSIADFQAALMVVIRCPWKMNGMDRVEFGVS